MRKLILYVATSLDGYIARENGDVDFLDFKGKENYGYPKFSSSVDTVLLGYKTYEKSLSFPGNPFENKEYYVFTRKTSFPDDKRVHFVNKDMNTFVSSLLKTEKRKNIWLMGGGDFVQSVMEANIRIDELMIFVLPLILGSGLPLFVKGLPETRFVLKDSHAYSNGLVKLHYLSKE